MAYLFSLLLVVSWLQTVLRLPFRFSILLGSDFCEPFQPRRLCLGERPSHRAVVFGTGRPGIFNLVVRPQIYCKSDASLRRYPNTDSTVLR